MISRSKLAWIGVLYFGSGLPFGIAFKAWPVYFRLHGVPLAEIGLMSLLFLPYTLKPVWAPLVDRFGSRQRWVVGSLVALAALVVALSRLDAGAPTPWLWTTLLAFTVASATQDVAIDAYAVDVAEGGELGPINGARVATYRAAMVVGGGLLLVAADALSWGAAWALAALLLAGLAVAAARSPRAPREHPAPAVAGGFRLGRWRALLLAATAVTLAGAWAGGWSAGGLTLVAVVAAAAVASFVEPDLLAWMGRREMVPALAFVALYKLGDSTLMRMVETFWIDRGLSPTEVGLVSTTLGTGLLVVGALVGGWCVARWGLFAALVVFGIGQALSNVAYFAVAALELPRASLYAASVIESLTQGLGTAAFLSFLMALCDREHAATQFALLTALFSLSRDLAGALSGVGVERLGYDGFFALTALAAVPGLALLPAVREQARRADER